MSNTLNEEWQQITANGIIHAFSMAGRRAEQAASAYDLPSVLYRPKLFPDGNKWCALYGDNLQDGFAAFGESPGDAMHQFDMTWHKAMKVTE